MNLHNKYPMELLKKTLKSRSKRFLCVIFAIYGIRGLFDLAVPSGPQFRMELILVAMSYSIIEVLDGIRRKM